MGKKINQLVAGGAALGILLTGSAEKAQAAETQAAMIPTEGNVLVVAGEKVPKQIRQLLEPKINKYVQLVGLEKSTLVCDVIGEDTDYGAKWEECEDMVGNIVNAREKVLDMDISEQAQEIEQIAQEEAQGKERVAQKDQVIATLIGKLASRQ